MTPTKRSPTQHKTILTCATYIVHDKSLTRFALPHDKAVSISKDDRTARQINIQTNNKLFSQQKCVPFLCGKLYKQIRRIVVPSAATNLTLKKVKGQGHGMVPIESACHKDYACQIAMLYL